MRTLTILLLLSSCHDPASVDERIAIVREIVAPSERVAAEALMRANIGVGITTDGESDQHVVDVGLDEASYPGDLDDNLMRNLADFPELRVLQVVRGIALDRGKVTNRGLAAISELAKLEDLCLTGVKLDTTGMKQLRKLTSLRKLAIDRGKISGEGIAELADLHKLKELYLSTEDIQDSDLEVIGKLTALESLSLNGSPISDIGVIHLKGLSHLRELSLNSTHVGETGMQSLASIKSLEQLELMDTPITDKGLGLLRALPKLRRLNVIGTYVTQAGAKQFGADLKAQGVAVKWRSNRARTQENDN